MREVNHGASVAAGGQSNAQTIALAIGVLAITGLAVAGLIHEMKARAVTIQSLGVRLLVASLPFLGIGIAGYLVQDSFEKGSFLDGLIWVSLFAFLFGLFLLFVGLGATLVESIRDRMGR